MLKAEVGQRSLVSYFGLVAWPITETKSDKSRLGEAAEGRTSGIVREQGYTNPERTSVLGGILLVAAEPEYGECTRSSGS